MTLNKFSVTIQTGDFLTVKDCLATVPQFTGLGISMNLAFYAGIK
jgi:hypothetical protein